MAINKRTFKTIEDYLNELNGLLAAMKTGIATYKKIKGKVDWEISGTSITFADYRDHPDKHDITDLLVKIGKQRQKCEVELQKTHLENLEYMALLYTLIDKLDEAVGYKNKASRKR